MAARTFSIRADEVEIGKWQEQAESAGIALGPWIKMQCNEARMSRTLKANLDDIAHAVKIETIILIEHILTEWLAAYLAHSGDPRVVTKELKQIAAVPSRGDSLGIVQALQRHIGFLYRERYDKAVAQGIVPAAVPPSVAGPLLVAHDEGKLTLEELKQNMAKLSKVFNKPNKSRGPARK